MTVRGDDLQLQPQHEALLAASAIAPSVAAARGYRSVTVKAELRRLGFSAAQARTPSLLIPICDVTGDIALYQARPDKPRIERGKAVKYETPLGARMVLDVPPSVRPRLGDPAVPLWVTEGVRKADAAVSAGLCCIALLGVWNWRGTNETGGKTALPDWESIALNDREVYVVFDSDVVAKREVAQALGRLKSFLESRGAHVRIVYLPAAPGGAKVGLDDFLAAGHPVDDLLALTSDGIAAPMRPVPDRETELADRARRSQASDLVQLADDAELFHTPSGEPFATVEVGAHRETHAVRSLAFRGWLRQCHWAVSKKPVTASALVDAVETLAARAEFGGGTRPVAIRVARHEGSIFVDLANDAWEAVEIGPKGWRVVPSSPVRFRRARTMEALPTPVHGGSLGLLRPFVNLAEEASWHLFVGTLVAAFRPIGPYLVLILHGEQGSAKSTTAKIMRRLVDPSRSPLRAEPREVQDLLIAAQNNWLVAFDNMSHLPPWLSDALCRLSTGGGLGKRQLYTDQDEIVLDAQRPTVLNGISEPASRGDLLDRAIILEQPTINDVERRSEDAFWQAFEAVRPPILGALFDAVSASLANEASVTTERLPRMADPARWVTAAEAALGWPSGTFLAAYGGNRREGHALALEASLLAAPLHELARAGDWVGTARALLARLSESAGEQIARQREWPRNPRALAEALKRLAPSLRASGIEWKHLERTGSARLHSIRMIGGTTVTTVTTVSPSTATDDGRAPGAGKDRHAVPTTVTLDRAVHDGRDGHDGSPPGLWSPDALAGPHLAPDPGADEDTRWTA